MLEMVITARSADLGHGLLVRRVLPYAKRRMGVALAVADEVDTARDKAKRVSSAVVVKA